MIKPNELILSDEQAPAELYLNPKQEAVGGPSIFRDGVIWQESRGRQFDASGNPLTSKAGATGRAQVMPATGPEAARLAGLEWDPHRFRNDAEYNTTLGEAYFNKQLEDFGDPAKALAAYNAGPGATRRAIQLASADSNPESWLQYLPSETQKYVPSVLERVGGNIGGGKSATPRLLRPRLGQVDSGFYDRLVLDENPSEEPAKKDRSILAAINDTVIDTANSAVGLVKAGVDLFAPDSDISASLGDFIKKGQDSQSDYKKALNEQLRRDLKNAGDDELTKAGVQLKHMVAVDPLGTFGQVFGNIGPFAILGRGMQAAKFADGVRTAISSTVAGGMGAGEVRGNIWERINSTPDAELMEASPAYAKLRSDGMSEADAKREVGANIENNIPEVALVGLVSALSGKFGVEGMAAGVAPKYAAGRLGAAAIGALDEGVIQGGGEQLASNYGVQRVIPSQSLTQDLGSNMVAEGISGVAMGAAFGGSIPPKVEPINDPLKGVREAATQPNSPLSRAGLAAQGPEATRLAELEAKLSNDGLVGDEATEYATLKAQADAAAAAQTQAPQREMDPITQRATEIEDFVRANGVMNTLRDIGQAGLTDKEFLEALAVAKNPSLDDDVGKPLARQRAIESLEEALRWVKSGKMPGIELSDERGLATTPSGDLVAQEGQPYNPNQIGDPVPRLTDPNVIEAGEGDVTWRDGGPGYGPADGSGGAPHAESPWRDFADGQAQDQAQPTNVFGDAPTQETAAQEAVQPAEPVSYSFVPAPKVEIPQDGPGTAQVRKRKAEIGALVGQGFDTITQDATGAEVLANQKTGEAHPLTFGFDRKLAKDAIRGMVRSAADQSPNSPNNRMPQSTPAQNKAGNYLKPPVSLNGFSIRVENPKGSKRSGTDPDGKAWSVTMGSDYGYINGTRAADGDGVDVYVGDNPEAAGIFVIDQINPDGSFDEPKVVMGVSDEAQARATYLSNYEPGWTGLGDITPMTRDQFDDWLKTDGPMGPTSPNLRQSYDGSSNKGASDEVNRGASPGLGPVAEGAGGQAAQAAGGEPADAGRMASVDGPIPAGRAAEDGGLQAARSAIGRLVESERARGTPVEIAEPAPDDRRLKAFEPLAAAFGKVFGRRPIAVVATGKAAFDGVMHEGDYFVNLDAAQMPLPETIAHEFGHTQEDRPEVRRLEDAMMALVPGAVRKKFYGYLARTNQVTAFKKPDGEVDLDASYAAATPEDLALLQSELIKDFMGKRFNDRAWLQRLAREKPKEFGDFIREWIKLLDNLIQEFKGAIGRAAEKDVDALMREHLAQLEQMKSIAIEVAAEWANANPELASKTGGTKLSNRAEAAQAQNQAPDQQKQAVLATETIASAAQPGRGQTRRADNATDVPRSNTAAQADALYRPGYSDRDGDAAAGRSSAVDDAAATPVLVPAGAQASGLRGRGLGVDRPDVGRARNRRGDRRLSARTSEPGTYGDARPGAVTVTGYHYSKQPRTTLSSSLYGTGLRGAEAERLARPDASDIRSRIHFYVNTGNGVNPEQGVGPHPHQLTMRNLYDASADELGLVRNAKPVGDEPGANAWERAIMQAGFDGYVVRDRDQVQGQAILVGKHQVKVIPGEPKPFVKPAPRTAPREPDAPVTRRVGDRLVRRMIPGDFMEIQAAKPLISDMAPSFKVEWGEASAVEKDAEVVNAIMEERGAKFRFSARDLLPADQSKRLINNLKSTGYERLNAPVRVASEGGAQTEVNAQAVLQEMDKREEALEHVRTCLI